MVHHPEKLLLAVLVVTASQVPSVLPGVTVPSWPHVAGLWKLCAQRPSCRSAGRPRSGWRAGGDMPARRRPTGAGWWRGPREPPGESGVVPGPQPGAAQLPRNDEPAW